MPTPYKLAIVGGSDAEGVAQIQVGIYPGTVDPLALVQATDANGNPLTNPDGTPQMLRANAPIATFSASVNPGDGPAQVEAECVSQFTSWTQEQAAHRAFAALEAQYASLVLDVTDQTT